MSESYRSIASPVEALYKEKGSKFLAYLYPVHSEEDVKKHLSALRVQYPDATHHCHAYCLGAQREKSKKYHKQACASATPTRLPPR